MSQNYNCKLLPTQQKKVEKIIVENGFLLDDFEWGTTDFYVSNEAGMGGIHYLSSKLIYNITDDDFYFKFNQAIKRFKPEFSPAPGQRFVHLSDWVNWDDVERFFKGWLILLLEEIEALGFLGKSSEFGFVDIKNAEFIANGGSLDEKEIKSIEVILEKIENKIAERLELEEHQHEFTKNEFNEIKKNIRILSKSGSRKFIIGTIINIGLFISDKINFAQLSKLIGAEINQILIILNEGIRSLPY